MYFLLCLALLSVSSHAAPSFSCKGTLAPDEKKICEDESLGRADQEMANLYRKKKGQRSAQRAWLQRRAACGSDATCLHQAYSDRLLELGIGPPPQATGEKFRGLFKERNGRIYYDMNALPAGVDASTFHVLDGDYDSYAATKSQVFYRSKLLDHADPASFRLLEGGYAKDTKHVYYEGWPVEGADAATFREKAETWFIDAHHVYHHGDAVAGADPASFQVLKDGYEKDATSAFYWEKKLEGSEGKTLQVLGVAGSDSNAPAYAKDAKQVYYGGELVKGADPATFSIRDNYGFDSAHVYSGKDLVPGESPKTFQPGAKPTETLEGGYARDAKHVYFDGKVLGAADPKTFAIVAFNNGAKNGIVFAKDAKHVFYHGGWGQRDPSEIAGADPSSFQVLDKASYSGAYAKDAHAVYYGGDRIEGADPASFQDLHPYGKDKQHAYFGAHRIEGSDPATFTVVGACEGAFMGPYYTKDKNAVYHYGKKMAGADAASFHLECEEGQNFEARDNKHRYLGANEVP